jgi:hypothetical protein
METTKRNIVLDCRMSSGHIFIVMAGLVPAIHAFTTLRRCKAWMPGTRPGMKRLGDALHPED